MALVLTLILTAGGQKEPFKNRIEIIPNGLIKI
jgi:hypothetical protein